MTADEESRRTGRPLLGAVEWLHLGDYDHAERVIENLRRLGIQRLRTGISWADFHTPEGGAWYDWLIPHLARHVELLPCVTYTPPSLGLAAKTSSPPRRPRAYADFLDILVTRHGQHFDYIELWNEPNNLLDWDWRLDPDWHLFSHMIIDAAHWMQQRGKKTVLGGMCPTDFNWLRLMKERGALRHIDVISLHAFCNTWTCDFTDWQSEVEQAEALFQDADSPPRIWVTEAGYSTWRHDEAEQLKMLADALTAPVERFYWYGLSDLHPERSSQEGFHIDERHYHFGLVTPDGRLKLAARTFAAGGADKVKAMAAMVKAPAVRSNDSYLLVTGGAGFLGSNITDRLAGQGQRVLVLDSLARPNVEENWLWLKERHGSRVDLACIDIRDQWALGPVLDRAEAVFHLAAQVAVTTSLADPTEDFEVNARGTLNLLEGLRRRGAQTPFLFASTNKVYGRLFGRDGVIRQGDRYRPAAADFALGADERTPLDLYSPYGCSKGVADQYVLDYARVYGLPAMVFRMSCLYGPRQFGTEDQGWVAHFLISALTGRPITIYGDGYQVRDLLYVDDAVDAWIAGWRNIQHLPGRVFNLGGGPDNTLSLRELIKAITDLRGRAPDLTFGDWRPGDQPWYVSDIRAVKDALSWQPRVPVAAGLGRLDAWLRSRFGIDQPVPEPKREKVRELSA